MAAAASPPGSPEEATAPEANFGMRTLQQQLQQQIETYEAEVLAKYRSEEDGKVLKQSLRALQPPVAASESEHQLPSLHREEDEDEGPDIDEQEVLRREETARKKQKRRARFGPDADEVYGGMIHSSQIKLFIGQKKKKRI